MKTNARIAIALASSALTGTAHAVCDHRFTSDADQEVFSLPDGMTARAQEDPSCVTFPVPTPLPPPPPGGRALQRFELFPPPEPPGVVECPAGVRFPSYRDWHRWAHNFDGWADRGDRPSIDGNREFDKHVVAGLLMNTGLADDNDVSFHAAVDYRWTSWKNHTVFRDSVRHVASDSLSFFGRFVHTIFPPTTDQIQTTCLLYATFHVDGKTGAMVAHPNANPGSRGGDFVHEGWHGWQTRRGYRGHERNPAGGHCTLGGANCDFFYFHRVSEYVFGALWETDRTAKRFHSPNQVQVEYLCDVADRPASWVPVSVVESAKLDANARSASRFINGPGIACGSPRPF